MTGRPRNPEIPSIWMHCPRCDAITEHRSHRRGKPTGPKRTLRCVPCSRAVALASYYKRRQAVTHQGGPDGT